MLHFQLPVPLGQPHDPLKTRFKFFCFCIQRQNHDSAFFQLVGQCFWDFSGGRAITDGDRERLQAGPMRWTCVDPLRHWTLELGPNETGIEWELHYAPRAPMWEMLPMQFALGGRTLLDMYHMKESGTWRGWVRIDGERIAVDGFHGGRDRTFGVRVANEIGFWMQEMFPSLGRGG